MQHGIFLVFYTRLSNLHYVDRREHVTRSTELVKKWLGSVFLGKFHIFFSNFADFRLVCRPL